MLAPSLREVRERLDALIAGQAPAAVGLWQRARSFFGSREAGAGGLDDLRRLDADFDRAGVLAAADARLLRELSTDPGRLGALAKGLEGRASAARQAYRAALDR
ncbi:MAG: VWA domain-containing protein, partial [Myxococcaceae bacterium]|nr:VWA domain-containing protein [Myxococcaceae bacterium]